MPSPDRRTPRPFAQLPDIGQAISHRPEHPSVIDLKPSNLQSLTGSRLRKHADYQRAYAGSRKRQSSSMSWFLARQTPAYAGAPLPDGPRVGLTCGKVIGKAHERNRIKRRMRDVLRRHVDALPEGFDLILHPRRVVLTIEFAKLEAEIVRILQQARSESKISPESRSMAHPPAPALPARAAP